MTNLVSLIPSPTHLISAPTKQGVEDLLLRILEKVYEPGWRQIPQHHELEREAVGGLQYDYF